MEGFGDWSFWQQLLAGMAGIVIIIFAIPYHINQASKARSMTDTEIINQLPKFLRKHFLPTQSDS